jgi:hypothetical protein
MCIEKAFARKLNVPKWHNIVRVEVQANNDACNQSM